MWEAYHQLRIAQTFRDSWETFLQQSVGRNAHPAFYQHVTHSIFKELIEWEFFVPPQTTPEDEHPNRPLSFVELNALRYVAGYICRKVKKQLDTLSLPFKDDMVHCIMHLAGDEVDCEETESWVNAIDRGGLWHVSDSTHSLFVILEQQTRRFFSTKSHHVREQQKDLIVSALMSDNDVLFQWCLLTTMINDDIARSLLEKIVQVYVTVRGFAFATSWLEMYKQSTKKNIQKKKALRKELHPSADR